MVSGAAPIPDTSGRAVIPATRALRFVLKAQYTRISPPRKCVSTFQERYAYSIHSLGGKESDGAARAAADAYAKVALIGGTPIPATSVRVCYYSYTVAGDRIRGTSRCPEDTFARTRNESHFSSRCSGDDGNPCVGPGTEVWKTRMGVHRKEGTIEAFKVRPRLRAPILLSKYSLYIVSAQRQYMN